MGDPIADRGERPPPFTRFLAVVPWLGQLLFALLCLFFPDAPRLVRRHCIAAILTSLALIAVVFAAGAVAGATEAAGAPVPNAAVLSVLGLVALAVQVLNIVAAAQGRGPFFRDPR